MPRDSTRRRVLLQLCRLSTTPAGALAEEAAREAFRTLPLRLALSSHCLLASGIPLVTVQTAVYDFAPFGHQRGVPKPLSLSLQGRVREGMLKPCA